MYTATLDHEVTIKKYTIVKDGVEKKITNIELQNSIISATDEITSINNEVKEIDSFAGELSEIQALHPDLHDGVDTRTTEQKKQLVYLNGLMQKKPVLLDRKVALEGKLLDLNDMQASLNAAS